MNTKSPKQKYSLTQILYRKGGYKTREGVRAVLSLKDKTIALTEINNSGFLYLPGGGIEGNESHEEALRRECLEETGCSIETMDKLGTVTALRYSDNEGLNRIDYCYSCQVKEKGQPTEHGAEVIFVTKEKALEILGEQFERITIETPNFYARKFNTKRDILILESLS